MSIVTASKEKCVTDIQTESITMAALAAGQSQTANYNMNAVMGAAIIGADQGACSTTANFALSCST